MDSKANLKIPIFPEIHQRKRTSEGWDKLGLAVTLLGVSEANHLGFKSYIGLESLKGSDRMNRRGRDPR